MRILFYCGGNGQFDELCSMVLDELRKQGYSEFKKYYINPYNTINPSGEHLWHYDGVKSPDIKSGPPRFTIVRRNDWMIDQADLILAYVLNGTGGAVRTLRYAWKKNKNVIQIGGDDFNKKKLKLSPLSE